MILRILVLIFVLLPGLGTANEKLVRLHAPADLIDSGLLKYALPRFSLKTQVRVELVPAPDGADMALGGDGIAVFQGPTQVWRMKILNDGHKGTQRLSDWLQSEVGVRTVSSYAPDGEARFGPPGEVEEEVEELAFEGDVDLGHKVSRSKCTRCHAVDEATRGWGIGSTPSFGVLRAMDDWESRFATFFALNPHPAFTQIINVTEPFPIDRPSPIAPVELTLAELEAMLAYVAAMPAADLGGPLQHQ